MLKSLSSHLAAGVNSAELEAKRSKEQLDALLYSKGLVDESLKIFGYSSGSLYRSAAQSTIFPTGSMAIPMCEQFRVSPPGSGRSFYSDQIQSTIQSGVSALIAASAPETQAGLDSLKQMLSTHNEELQSLEERLCSRLGPYSEHLETILRGALASYRDAGNSLRFVNAGTALRELLREFLGEVAPDTEVKKAPWFVPAKDASGGVTRRHRIDYAIFKNLTQEKFPKTFSEQADEIASALLKDIGKLSALTHVTEDVLEKSYTEAAPLFAAVMQRFILLVSAIETAKLLIEQDIAVDIQSHLDDIFTGDFFDELDCLSSHTRPQGASDVEVGELTFDEEWIEFSGTGSVDCDLQWGSDGDVSRGDGAESSASFPFKFSGRAPIGDPSKIEIDRESISVDTSSFYEGDDEEERS